MNHSFTTMTNLASPPYPALAVAPGFAPQSRVWVYTSDRRLTDAESAHAQTQLSTFCEQWTAHNQALKAATEIIDNQFIVLLVDETQAGASGCSIDKSVHFLEDLGQAVGADFFERMRFGWIDAEGNMQMSSRDEFSALVKNGRITADTPVVNTLVQTKQDLEMKWLLPFGKSWHKRLL